MSKIDLCTRCLLYAHDPHLVCAVHPDGVDSGLASASAKQRCIDFRPNPSAKIEEKWSPQGYSWYGDELIANKPSRYTSEEQIEMLDTHPMFTGVCPQCRHEFDKSNPPVVHWDCPRCGWVDDSV